MDRGLRASRSEQFSSAEKRQWSQLVTMPDSSSNISSSDGCEETSCQGHTGDGAMIMTKLQDVTDEGDVSNTAVKVI